MYDEMHTGYSYIAIQTGFLASHGGDVEEALAAHLRDKGYTVFKKRPEWPAPHFDSVSDLKFQSTHWVNADRELVIIKKMDLEYVANVLDYIRKYKPALMYCWPGGTKKSPLFKALEDRLEEAKRGTDYYRDRYRYRRNTSK